jgi:glucosamine--fructose-6-phosphate aminotransferase (isomerizing)
MTPPSLPHTYGEILSQGETLPVTLDRLACLTETAAHFFLADSQPLFLGSGASYYLARYAAALARALRLGPAVALPASEAWLLPEGYVESGQTAVAISRSGRTSELLFAADVVRQAGGRVLALTLTPGSPLTEHADAAIEFSHVHEESIVMTQSFSNLLLALQWLVGVRDKSDDRASRRTTFTNLLQSLRDLLPGLDSDARRLAREHPGHVTFLAMGAMEAVALEGMLNLKEMSQLSCDSFGTLEFRHGPISALTAETLVILLTTPRTSERDMEVAQEIVSMGGRCVVVGPRATTPNSLPYDWIALPEGFADWQYANLAVPFLQLFAYYVSIELGRNPDRPRSLTRAVELAM